MKSLLERFNEKVERTSGCWLWIGAKTQQGYGKMRIGGKPAPAHRISYELHVGPIAEGLLIDHRCHVKRCVRPSHLRVVTYKANAENRNGPQKGSKFGIWGVHWSEPKGKWAARVRHNGVLRYGGYFHDIEEAAEAVKALRLSLFTHNDVDRRSA